MTIDHSLLLLPLPHLKKQAKNLKRDLKIPMHAAYNLLAVMYNFPKWETLLAALKENADRSDLLLASITPKSPQKDIEILKKAIPNIAAKLKTKLDKNFTSEDLCKIVLRSHGFKQ